MKFNQIKFIGFYQSNNRKEIAYHVDVIKEFIAKTIYDAIKDSTQNNIDIDDYIAGNVYQFSEVLVDGALAALFQGTNTRFVAQKSYNYDKRQDVITYSIVNINKADFLKKYAEIEAIFNHRRKEFSVLLDTEYKSELKRGESPKYEIQIDDIHPWMQPYLAGDFQKTFPQITIVDENNGSTLGKLKYTIEKKLTLNNVNSVSMENALIPSFAQINIPSGEGASTAHNNSSQDAHLVNPSTISPQFTNS